MLTGYIVSTEMIATGSVNCGLGEMEMLIRYTVTMETTGLGPVNNVLAGMKVTLIQYCVTMETIRPGSISCDRASYYPGKKGVKKLICQQLVAYVTVTKSVLVYVSNDRSVNSFWNHRENRICKITRKAVIKIFQSTPRPWWRFVPDE